MAGDMVWVVRDARTGAVESVGYNAYEAVPDFGALLDDPDRSAWDDLNNWIDNCSGTGAEYRGARFTMRREPLLPLDPAQFDAAGVDEVCKVFAGPNRFESLHPQLQEMYRNDARDALAAYARTVGGGNG